MRVRWLVLLAFALMACQRLRDCRGGTHVAELSSLAGHGQREQGSGAWSAASVGDRFRIGDAIRTDHDGRARVVLTAGGGLNLGPDSLVRFVSGPVNNPSRASVRVESGEADLEASTGEVLIETGSGTARVETGSRARLRATSGGGPEFEVLVGHVELEDGSDGGVVANAGERLVVRVSGAILEAADGTPIVRAPRRPNVHTVVDAAVAVANVDAGTTPTAATDASTVAAAITDAGAAVDAGVSEPPIVARIRGRHAEMLDATGAWHRISQGPVQLEPGTHVRLPAGSTLDVRRGSEHESVHGVAEVIVAALDGPLVQSAATESAAARTTPEVPSPAPTETTTTRADLSIPAGESAAIHHLATTTAVRIETASVCAQGATIASAGTTVHVAAAEHAGVITLGPGSHRYDVRCADGSGGRRGSLRIVRDAGTAPMPRRAPHTSVDTDGRRYSVLYQNLLPEFTIRWPNAPSAGRYVLVVRDHLGHSQNIGSGSPNVSLPSGRLEEGSYTVSFQAGAQRSPDTVIQVRFDNAAQSAAITDPADGSVHGTSTHVSGTALAGSTVTVGVTRLQLDSENRFRGDVPVSPNDDAVAIRIAHPARGVHYYLRGRSSASP